MDETKEGSLLFSPGEERRRKSSLGLACNFWLEMELLVVSPSFGEYLMCPLCFKTVLKGEPRGTNPSTRGLGWANL